MDSSGQREPLLNNEPEKKYSLTEAFKSLKKNPRDFWMLFLLELFSLGPFSISVVSNVIYNTRILGFSDKEAGMLVGLLGISVAFSSIAFSNLPARYGLKWSFILSGILGMAFSFLMYLQFHKYIQIALTFFLFIPSAAICFISLKLGIKLFTFPESRSLGYSLFFMCFFLVAGFAAGYSDIVLSLYGTTQEAFDVIFSTCFIFNGLLVISAIPIRNLDVEASGEEHVELNRDVSGWEYTREVLVTRKFWKFFALIMLLTVIKSMYFHLTATLPLYMYRSIEEGAHFGYLMGIHQIVLLIFIPLLTALIRHFNFYSLLQIGSFVTALSPAVLLYDNNYVTLGIFVVFLSIGESIYAPRLVDYTIAAAPKGKEAIYLGLSNMPNSLGLLLTGITSGIFMSNFCPAGEPKDCYLVWILIGVYCLFACFAIFVFRGFFEEKPITDMDISEEKSNQAKSKNITIIE